ncbi:DNA mismatch endonuclease Vsr [Candidatus Omnitrophus magneticus]|uniref:DNA mismatch endonuclease Vsr n=1 Tax=Candidatus Omnitrophus magneticus TaxID=1609969 RepID=A0A0F0CMC0_9BACT|nr:DNA mismatch endonuclease Vsr [Candidatus Omnitrophus magneticus]
MVRKKIKNYLGRNLNRERSVDRLSGKARSELMSRIRSKNTLFERDFIKALKKRTALRFSINVASIKGKPDIVFRKQKVCVFLDSDFWHGWQYPRWKRLLKDDFWRDKIERNRNRDRRNTGYLRRERWIVVRIWEHNIKLCFKGSIQKVLNELE